MDDDAYVSRAAELLREEEVVGDASTSTNNTNATHVDGAPNAPAYSAQDPSGYYARLGVRPNATQQEIRRAFLFLSQRYHTDKHANQGGGLQSLMNERFQELQDAYTVLSDERQRAAYDASGDVGIQRLSLVPVGLHKRQDILNYVLSLDREAQLLQTAKMASASSQTTMNFSMAHFFPFHAAVPPDDAEEDIGAAGQQRQLEAPTASNVDKDTTTSQHTETDASSAATALHGTEKEQHGGSTPRASVSASPASPTAAAASPSPSQERTDARGTAAPPSAAATPSGGATALQAQLTAKEVVIDGERQIVLVPNPEVQQQLRRRIHGQEEDAPGGASASSPTLNGGARTSAGGAPGAGAAAARRPAVRRLATAQALMLAAIPKSTTFRSSFQHMLSPRLTLTFRTDAASSLRKNTSSLTASVEYQPDDIRTYGSSLRFAVNGLKWCLTQRRELSPLWALKSKLTALAGAQLLQKLELTLIRKLSATAELESALAMSLNEHGFFRSSINDYTEDAQQGVGTYIGFHSMYLTAYTGGKVLLGVDTKDPKNPPAHGRLQYSVNCSPLAGQTTMGVEAWYCPSRVQEYGLSFTTVLPYAISPIAPPLFLVESTQFAVVNQIALLYARGRHRISVPIIVFISPKVSQGLAWLAAPLAVYRIATMLYRPYARARAIGYYTQQRKRHIAETDVAREKARLEQLALESLVLGSRATEERKGGLVVLNARYGVLDPQYTMLPLTAAAAAAAAPASPVSAQATSPMPFSPSSASGGAANGSATPKPQSPTTSSTNPQSRRTLRNAGGAASASSSDSKGWWPSQVMARVAERLVRAGVQRRAAAAAKRRQPQKQPEGGAAGGEGKAEDEMEVDAYAARHDPVGTDAIPLSIDVTIAVQNLVRDAALTLPAGTKSTLVGFCDPDPYTPEQKKLKIVYWFRKRKHVAVFDDDEPVELPQREHLVA